MAGGPYRNSKGGNYYIKWSDTRGHPEEPKKTESLKTDKASVAELRKAKLESLYNENKHDPWVMPWHENDQIRPLIYGSLFDSNVNIKDIRPPQEDYIPSLLEASELFISYKTPDHASKKQTHQWSLDKTASNEATVIRKFVSDTGPGLPINRISNEHLKSFVEQDSITSDHTVANYVRSLTTFFNYCMQKHGWIKEKDKPTYNAPTPQASIPVFIYNDELYKICKYKIDKVTNDVNSGDGYPWLSNSQMYMPIAWILLRFTGMRPIELQKLHLDAIDLRHREITVGKPIDGRKNRTKTAVQRKIPMNDIVYEICKLIKDKDFRSNDRWMKKSDHIFGRSGNQSKKRLSKEFTEARKEVLPGRDEVTEYCLRDTFAVSKLTEPSEEINPMFGFYKVRDLMGHSKLTTTEKYWKAIPHRLHHQRLHNPKILCKIVREFHKKYT